MLLNGFGHKPRSCDQPLRMEVRHRADASLPGWKRKFLEALLQLACVVLNKLVRSLCPRRSVAVRSWSQAIRGMLKGEKARKDSYFLPLPSAVSFLNEVRHRRVGQILNFSHSEVIFQPALSDPGGPN